MKLLLLLLQVPLFGVSLVIDAGSPSDQDFTGGFPFAISQTLPPGADSTLRYGTAFLYRLPAQNIPYVIEFRFIEPTVLQANQRIFSITVNDQLVFPRLDLVAIAGYLQPVSRSVIVMGADEMITIRFDTIVRNALVSSIKITPLFEIFGSGLGPNTTLASIQKQLGESMFCVSMPVISQ